MKTTRPLTEPDRRFTKKAAAALIGVSPSTIRRWERQGKVAPSLTRYGVPFYTGAQMMKIWETLWR